MEFDVQNTLSSYRNIVNERSIIRKTEMFKRELMKPYEGMFNAMGASLDAESGKFDAMTLLKGWTFLMPADLGRNALEPLRKLESSDARSRVSAAMERVCDAFKDNEESIPLKHIHAGVFLMNPKKMQKVDRGYSGFGGIPGFVMLGYGDPDEHNLARMEAAAAHEAHHNIRLSVCPWDPANITVGEYLVMEGLAESFAATLFGKEKLSYYVTDFDMAEMPRVKEIIGPALCLKGFDKIMPYLYGDTKASGLVGPRLSLPPFAGYAVGYHLVQSFLEKTGKNIVEATFITTDKIIEESAFFG